MKRREEPIPALSAGLSHLMMTGLLLLVALPVVLDVHPRPAPGFHIEDAPAAASTSAEPSADIAAAQAKEEWPRRDIIHAREQCMHALAGTPVEFEWMEPIRKGGCGLPAPVRLKSIGSGSDKVVFEPAVNVNCRMAAALGKWVKTTLQPNARERLKSDVVRIVGSYGYSCRNIYNRPNAKLSQHALANAIDIGGFELANGRTVRVLKGWGMTARDIKAAKEKAAAEAKKAKASKEAKAKDDGETKAETARIEKPGVKVTKASLTSVEKAQTSEKIQSSDKKDAKDADDPAKSIDAKPTKESLFLRAIHGGACRQFKTVMGPEANDPHRNHFHLDLISRRGGYCE
jgi:hypothetical protein